MSAIVGRNAELTTVSPFISQPMFCPVALLRQMTSALPSPSKSPTPLISQFVSAIVGRNAELATGQPVHQPPDVLAGRLVAPEHVRLAVAVEVAQRERRPAGGSRRRPTRPRRDVVAFLRRWPCCRLRRGIRKSLAERAPRRPSRPAWSLLGQTRRRSSPSGPGETVVELPSDDGRVAVGGEGHGKALCSVPTAPEPTSLGPCWVQTPPLLVQTHTAPAELLSLDPPTMAVLPSAERDTE